MAQNFYSLDVTKDVKTVIPQMQTSLESVASNFSGEVFPTSNLFVGMKCYRTDLKNTYKWDGTDWLLDSPSFATDDEAKAGTIDDKIMSPARVKTAVDSIIDNIKGETNGIATLDSMGKIPTAQIPQLDYAETADKLKTARKIGGVSFDGSVDIDLPGVNKIGTQDTSGTAATATLANKFATRTDNITNTKDDTPANWSTKGPGTWFYSTTGQLNGQPSQYGHLFNMVNGTSECSQIWVNSNSADVYVRGGNASGWGGGSGASFAKLALESELSSLSTTVSNLNNTVSNLNTALTALTKRVASNEAWIGAQGGSNPGGGTN